MSPQTCNWQAANWTNEACENCQFETPVFLCCFFFVGRQCCEVKTTSNLKKGSIILQYTKGYKYSPYTTAVSHSVNMQGESGAGPDVAENHYTSQRKSKNSTLAVLDCCNNNITHLSNHADKSIKNVKHPFKAHSKHILKNLQLIKVECSNLLAALIKT